MMENLWISSLAYIGRALRTQYIYYLNFDEMYVRIYFMRISHCEPFSHDWLLLNMTMVNICLRMANIDFIPITESPLRRPKVPNKFK